MADKALEDLKARWYQKLKESGFKDAEDKNGRLKDWPNQRIPRDYSTDTFKEKQEYYRLASQLYYDYPFPNTLHHRIWGLHSAGESLREIAQKLRSKKNKLNKDSLQKIISKYARLVRRQLLNEEK